MSCVANQSVAELGASARAPHVGERGLRRLLHDVAELAGDRAACPCPASRVASTNSTSPPTGVQASPVATPGSRVRRSDLGLEARRGRAARAPAARRSCRLARLPSATCARPCGRPRRSRARGRARRPRACSSWMIACSAVVGERDLRPLQPVALDLARDEVALGDLELLLLRVAGELDDLHAVAQRPGIVSSLFAVVMNMTAREVERQVEVVVAEGRVLLGVEHLEHRARRVAAEVRAHLVDLVDHEQRVVASPRRAARG